MMSKLQIFVALSCIGLARATYPATYPFDTEIIAEMPVATPSLSFDETDPGGYYLTYLHTLDLNTVEFPFCALISNYAMFALVFVWGAPPVLPIQTWNCTAKNLFFADADFTGKINGQDICNVGSCCQDLIGEVKYGEDQMSWHDTIATISAAAGCGDMTEGVYCALVDGHFRTNCMERIISPGDRLVTFSCPDNHWFYWTACKTVNAIGLDLGIPIEPPLYVDRQSNENKIWQEIFVNNNDYVCHPMSFYAPESSSSTDGGDSSASNMAKLVFTLAMVLAAL